MAKTIVRVTTRGFAREETIEKVGRRGALVTLQAGTDDLRSVTVEIGEDGKLNVYVTRMVHGSAEQVGEIVLGPPKPPEPAPRDCRACGGWAASCKVCDGTGYEPPPLEPAEVQAATPAEVSP